MRSLITYLKLSRKYLKPGGKRTNHVASDDSLINAIRYQLDNTLFTFGGKVFKQKIGIPMGIDDGPEFANGNLHQLEYKYLNDLKKKYLQS